MNAHHIRKKLEQHVLDARRLLSLKHPHAALKILASGALASSLVLGIPAFSEAPKDNLQKMEELPQTEREKLFSDAVKLQIATSSLSISPIQEMLVSKLIYDYWGINATPVLDGRKLNHSYAFMGYEQHLRRYPGDTIFQHDEFQKAGMAPGRGAFGYFANSKSELTPDVIQREKYYVAVQTLYLSDWNTNWVELKEWYKFRKVVVVNPENGKTVVADIADAGPAQWTGKQFGGSPEVMEHLGLVTGKKKGRVILFFVDDPNNEIALGPVGYTQMKDIAQK